METNKEIKSLSTEELFNVNGGSEQTYQNGVNHGRAIKEAIVNAYNATVDWVSSLF